MKILLGGIPLGCDNIGDEAILWSVQKMLRDALPGVEITVATADPATAERLGVEVAPPFGFAGRSIDGFADVARRHDAYVWCGATGLSDYPHVALDLLEAAQNAGVPTFVWAVGMDDELNPVFFRAHGRKRAILSPLGLTGWYEAGLRRRLAKRISRILPRCRGVWLRDPQSAKMLSSMGFSDVGIAADTAILCNIRPSDAPKRSVPCEGKFTKISSSAKPSNCQTVKPSNCQTAKPSNCQTAKPSNCQTVKPSNELTGKRLGLCISTQRQVSDLDGVKGMIAEVRSSGVEVLGIPMNPKTDRRLLESLGVNCIPGDTWQDVCEAAAQCSVILSSRLHLLILAANVGTPILGIARGSKLANWLANFGRTVEGSVQDCDWRKVSRHVLAEIADRSAWDAARQTAYAKLTQRFDDARKQFISRL